MQRVLRRSAAIILVVAALAAPAALADDPAIQPPLPQTSSPVSRATFWQIMRIVLFKA
jgi:hypothetical protein